MVSKRYSSLVTELTNLIFIGIEMLGTPWSDGVPGVTQREIPPGDSFVYKWTATQYGEYWYHAHHSGQLDDGSYGALIIYPKDDTPTPFSLISQEKDTLKAIENAVANIQPLVLSDWRNIPSAEAEEISTAAAMEIPCYDSLLINGQGRVDCWSAAKIASLLTPTQRQLLLLNNMTAMTPKAYALYPIDYARIDGHELTCK